MKNRKNDKKRNAVFGATDAKWEAISLTSKRHLKRHWHTMVGTSMNFPTCCNVAVAKGTESVWLPEFMSIGLNFGCFLSIL